MHAHIGKYCVLVELVDEVPCFYIQRFFLCCLCMYAGVASHPAVRQQLTSPGVYKTKRKIKHCQFIYRTIYNIRPIQCF